MSAFAAGAAGEEESVEVDPFLGRNFAITVRHSESPDLSRVRRRTWSVRERTLQQNTPRQRSLPG